MTWRKETAARFLFREYETASTSEIATVLGMTARAVRFEVGATAAHLRHKRVLADRGHVREDAEFIRLMSKRLGERREMAA